MSSTRPLGSGDNFFRAKLQLPLLNARYEGLPRSYVVEHIFAISTLVEKEDTFSKIRARVYAVAIPMFLGASIIQLFLVTTCDIVTSCSGYSRKEYVVIDQGEVDKKALETRDTSPYKGVKELALHVAAIATTLICYVPGIFAPGIYCRDDLKPLPKTIERQSHEKELTSEQQKHKEELTVGQQSHKEQLTIESKKHAQELLETKLELEKVQAEKDRLLEANKTAKLDALFEMFPKITSHNFREIQSLLSSPELEGITLSVVTEEDRTVVSEEGKKEVYSQATWGTADGEAFDKAKDSYTSVKLTNKQQFLEPIGTIELRIDCREVASRHLKLLLAQSHQIHRLVLINPDIEVLKIAEQEGVLSNIHSLVIQEHEDLKCDQLYQIADRFKNIACFDVRGCPLDQELSEVFMAAHIVCQTRCQTQKTVQFADQKGFDNIEEQFEHLNKTILFEQMMKTFDRKSSDALHFAKFLPPADQKSLFHPAAPFVTKLCCFRGSEIGSIHLKNLMPRLAKSFPHLRVLDFGGCKLLDCEALSYMQNYPVLNLYLNGCEGIFYRQFREDQELSRRKTKTEYVFQNGRHYLLDYSYVTNRFLDLFKQGTKLIRVQSILKTSQQRSPTQLDRKRKEHFETIKSHLERQLFPEMHNMAQPPRSHGTYIGVSTGLAKGAPSVAYDCRRET